MATLFQPRTPWANIPRKREDHDKSHVAYDLIEISKRMKKLFPSCEQLDVVDAYQNWSRRLFDSDFVEKSEAHEMAVFRIPMPPQFTSCEITIILVLEQEREPIVYIQSPNYVALFERCNVYLGVTLFKHATRRDDDTVKNDIYVLDLSGCFQDTDTCKMTWDVHLFFAIIWILAVGGKGLWAPLTLLRPEKFGPRFAEAVRIWWLRQRGSLQELELWLQSHQCKEIKITNQDTPTAEDDNILLKRNITVCATLNRTPSVKMKFVMNFMEPIIVLLQFNDSADFQQVEMKGGELGCNLTELAAEVFNWLGMP